MKFLCCEAVQKGLGCKARDGRSFDYAAQDRLGRGVLWLYVGASRTSAPFDNAQGNRFKSRS